jgi:cob(I)alamin adenosyltransferase
MVKIYTKTGDKGQTSLFTGHRVSKSSPYIQALGTVDECNSCIGTALSFLPNDSKFKKIQEQFFTIQNALFDLGAALATPRTIATNAKILKTRFDNEGASQLEKWIDEMEEELSPLNEFILPGGHSSAALAHLARSVCRRAERDVLPLAESGDVSESVTIYLNRLSDYLFVSARYLNHLCNTLETRWTHGGTSSN